jgi:hypothetical protein
VHDVRVLDRRLQMARGREQEVAFGDDADELPGGIEHRHVVERVLLHQHQGRLVVGVAGDGDGMRAHAVAY